MELGGRVADGGGGGGTDRGGRGRSGTRGRGMSTPAAAGLTPVAHGIGILLHLKLGVDVRSNRGRRPKESLRYYVARA